MYVNDHPLALNLDIDRVRSLLGQWQDHPQESGLLARAVALAAARTHLTSGYDVVIPQYLGRAQFLEQAERLAVETGARFDEIVLLDSKENSLHWFSERSRAAADPAHVEAQEMLDRGGGREELSQMYERLLTVVASRPSAKIVQAQGGQVVATYRVFVNNLS